MSETECLCVHCLKKATQILERAELGQLPERLSVCDAEDCQPQDGEWNRYSIDAPEPVDPTTLGAA